jgi:tungstate transport system permease protein
VQFIIDVVQEALELVGDFGPELRRVVVLTLWVSASATLIGVMVGVPLGLVLGLHKFTGRGFIMLLVNTGMGIPPVLAGLLLLLLLWSDGPLGSWGLLFTPAAMIMVQAFLAIPIAAGVTAGAVRGISPDAREQLSALRLGGWTSGTVAVREAWPGVAAAVAAAFGRVISEVGAVLIVGGNIAGETRVLTTAIVQETRQANFGPALALGLILLVFALVINGALTYLQLREEG